MPRPNDLNKSILPFDQHTTLIAVIEMSQSSWLAAGVVPGVERRPLKKLDPEQHYCIWWRGGGTGGQSRTDGSRAVLAFEAGRDGFWLARWLRARDIETYVVHSTSVAVSREHRRAKTDRLDTEMLIRVFLGWLRGEPRHCKMVAIPTLEEEDAKRPSRERENLVGERTRIINRMKAALTRLGVRGFKPELLKAPERLEAMRTPEGVQIPPNMLDELRRDMARLAWVREQINAIEQARLGRLEQAPAGVQTQWFDFWRASSAWESRRRTCWFKRSCRETYEIGERSPAMPASQDRPMKAVLNAARGVWQRRAMLECVAASCSWRGGS